MALCLKQVFNKDKTFRPRKKFEPGTQRFELYKKAQASLKSGLDLKTVVQLPPGENINDWIAVHLVDFFNRINLIYGTISEFCTEKSCPIMSGGLKYEYRWQDDYRFKRPTKLSAPHYMCMLMDWIETLINNENIFPTRIGVPFPKNFQQVCTKILTRLFRVFVHVYIHHFDSIIGIGAEAHVNTCYKHFYYFINEFSLVDQRELEPLVRNILSSFLLLNQGCQTCIVMASPCDLSRLPPSLNWAWPACDTSGLWAKFDIPVVNWKGFLWMKECWREKLRRNNKGIL
uniref:MOB kinase activator 3C n=1 Tax=Naja naja TaxID=35670 RepID=A0A8C7DZ49_NAJNA